MRLLEAEIKIRWEGGKRKRVISKKYKNKNKTCYTLNVKMEIVCKILKTTNVIDLF